MVQGTGRSDAPRVFFHLSLRSVLLPLTRTPSFTYLTDVTPVTMDRFLVRHTVRPVPVPFRIEGVSTALTPHPDDAELAAQALLESMMDGGMKKGETRREKTENPAQGTPAYYRALAVKIRTAREQERRAAMRYVAYVEEQLANGRRPIVDGQSLERGLYGHQDAVERGGGELLRRWRHCLAECIVRQMTAPATPDNTDTKQP